MIAKFTIALSAAVVLATSAFAAPELDGDNNPIPGPSFVKVQSAPVAAFATLQPRVDVRTLAAEKALFDWARGQFPN
jgi:hypothetical protein